MDKRGGGREKRGKGVGGGKVERVEYKEMGTGWARRGEESMNKEVKCNGSSMRRACVSGRVGGTGPRRGCRLAS